MPSKEHQATFVSKIAYDLDVQEKYGLERMVLPVQKTRNLGKVHMLYNNKVGDMNIDPETYKVTWNGDLIDQPRGQRATVDTALLPVLGRVI